jgi:c-di-GMP-binding flagellar brake protein YcgR
MLEKRKVRRRNSFYYLEVFEEETKNFVGRLINITTDGIMLESEEPIEVKKGYRLSMELPNSFVWKPKIIFDAKSVWCRKDGDFETYKAGFQFQNLDTKVEKQVNRLVEKFKH